MMQFDVGVNSEICDRLWLVESPRFASLSWTPACGKQVERAEGSSL